MAAARGGEHSQSRRSEAEKRIVLAWKVAEALDSLPPELKSVSVMRFIEGLSVKEISKELGIPAEEVMKRQYEALMKLGKRIEGDE